MVRNTAYRAGAGGRHKVARTTHHAATGAGTLREALFLVRGYRTEQDHLDVPPSSSKPRCGVVNGRGVQLVDRPPGR